MPTNAQVLRISALRLAKARGITTAAAAQILQAHPDVLAECQAQLAGMTAEQIEAEETIDSPSAFPALPQETKP